jgi:histone deacetylase 1/2
MGDTDRKRKVAYFYSPEMGKFYYGHGHPMKPHRVRMTHSLIIHSGLYDKMDCYVPSSCSSADMEEFHSRDYLDVLESAGSGGDGCVSQRLKDYNMHDDCPVFEGLWEYNQIAAGGTLGASLKLNQGLADIAISWSGGLHHGKKSEASGFCYVNDIVLGILELLKNHQRVLYIDIDVHHGDGVEEAFLTTDRVLCLSFHKFGDNFFPQTGDIVNVGHGEGKYYSVNVPLRDGLSDHSFEFLFRPIVDRIMMLYRPDVVVLQCGADSLADDRLGVFNLSSKGHSLCLRHLRSYNVPLMVLGGGGYTTKNVAKCWAAETAIAIGEDLEELPVSEYFEYYSPSYSIKVDASPNKTDRNDRAYLQRTLEKVMHNLSFIYSPSTEHKEAAPPTPDVFKLVQEEDGVPVVTSPNRPPQQMWKH